MLHFKTYYLNVSDEIKLKKPKAELNSSRIIRFCNHTMATYASVVNKISEVFLNIELGVRHNYITDISYISIILPNWSSSKFKSEDSESTLFRICWFIENMKPTSNGLVISVYLNNDYHNLEQLDSHWNLNNLWIANKTWDISSEKGNYVTVQHPEKNGLFWNQIKFYENWEVIEKYLAKKNIEIKTISYRTSIEEIYNLLLNTKLHIGYIGSCYFISALTRTPTLGLGKDPMQDPFIEQNRKNCWGTGCMAPDRVLQINSNGEVYNGFVMGSIDTMNTEYVKKLISDVIEKNNYDEFLL